MRDRSKKDEEGEPRAAEDAELEREIRSGREFTVAEAIGRAAGDLLKGTSPVTHRRQAELEVEHYLEAHLADSEGALRAVLLRRVGEDEEFLSSGYERPLAVLGMVIERALGNEGRLGRLVRQVDIEWGRLYSERPHFDSDGQAPHPDDPYTIESVRDTLTALLEQLHSRG